MFTQYKSYFTGPPYSQNWRLSGLAVSTSPRCRHSSASACVGKYAGSADAIYQSLNLIYDEDPDYIVVFGADHLPYGSRTDGPFHIDSGAGATVAGIRVPREMRPRSLYRRR